ncbi:SixA phosphatase family protein [Paracidobacterium acidisoli]|uniref:Phosphohistidine phosphatase n=1 Tax=Paracidobacterium acidisoli TaxID=2303751 RepID=A0A372IQ93_9BACT|nr:histidine phosphatase family protein [Paracidobacterium acidisoli]MBT9331011.1 histidine phosphatase family protein [Paracidobacterium acidisoli]
MNLYILRHASAGIRRDNPVIDVRRPLDKEGKQQCMLVGSYLNAFRVQFDVIVSSPLKRALQTASFVGTEVGYDSKIVISDALLPNAPLADFQKLIADLSKYDNVLVVGHNPNLPVFLGSIIAPPGKAAIRLRKGAIARIDCARRPGLLHWLVDPRILRGVYARVTKSSRRKTSRK